MPAFFLESCFSFSDKILVDITGMMCYYTQEYFNTLKCNGLKRYTLKESRHLQGTAGGRDPAGEYV